MQHYELLFILPGTLSEDQVGPAAVKVKEVVASANGKNIEIQDLGKSRIAYPIKHIRYGYFQMIKFEAETEDVTKMSDKVRLMSGLLRAVISKRNPKGFILDKVSAISDVLIREANTVKNLEGGEEKKQNQEIVAVLEDENATAGHQMDSPKTRLESKEVKVNTETKVENIKMEDIDKRLDELLETNIADV